MKKFNGLNVNDAAQAIRRIDGLDCASLRILLNAIASKMAQSGFGDLDMTAIDECVGFVCGEEA